jgi:hypothetical protein
MFEYQCRLFFPYQAIAITNFLLYTFLIFCAFHYQIVLIELIIFFSFPRQVSFYFLKIVQWVLLSTHHFLTIKKFFYF